MKPNSLNTIFQYSFVCFVNPFLTGGFNSLFGISGTFGFLFEETKIIPIAKIFEDFGV
jgi:hypothetical protein